jgi:hypothetical protein
MVDEKGNCYVDNFAILCYDYGCVIFDGRTNVSNLNLDEIGKIFIIFSTKEFKNFVFFQVQIRHKEICIYPDETKKPPVGEGLNKEAEVTLFRVWPVDKHTNRPICDPIKLMNMRYDKKIEKMTIQMAAKFVYYNFEIGSWTFEVKNFSNYGLKADDSENDENHSCTTLTLGEPTANQQQLLTDLEPTFSVLDGLVVSQTSQTVKPTTTFEEQPESIGSTPSSRINQCISYTSRNREPS